ncbi:MAG: cytochrome C, partial [Gammaproteobacteria bacterium]
MFDPRPLLRLLPLAAGLLLANPAAAQPSTPAPSTAWPASKGRAPFHPPAEDQIPDNRFGRLVRYGEHVFVDTQILRGKYVGNGLQCVSCHLDRGRLANASPMWAAYVGYPKHLKKSGREITLTQRIQGCFRFSMNGSPPPANGRVIKALEAYFHWLATGAPKGVALKGAGYPPIAEPDRAPSIARGKQVYEADCA